MSEFSIGEKVFIARTSLRGEVIEKGEFRTKVRVSGGAIVSFDNHELHRVVPVPVNGKPVVKPRRNLQIRMTPSGVKPTEAVRAVLASADEPTEVQAHKVGMNERTFRYIRKLLLLKNEASVSPTQQQTVDKALELIDTTLELKPAMRMTADIMNEHWTERTQGGKTRPQRAREARQRETLDNAIFRVRELCDSTEELVCPPLELGARLEAAKSLSSSIAALSALLQRLMQQGDDKHD